MSRYCIEPQVEFELCGGGESGDHRPFTGTGVKAVLVAERESVAHYDIETSRMLAIVAPADEEPSSSEPRSNGQPQRIGRDDAVRIRRIRAAHR